MTSVSKIFKTKLPDITSKLIDNATSEQLLIYNSIINAFNDNNYMYAEFKMPSYTYSNIVIKKKEFLPLIEQFLEYFPELNYIITTRSIYNSFSHYYIVVALVPK